MIVSCNIKTGNSYYEIKSTSVPQNTHEFEIELSVKSAFVRAVFL